MLDLATALFQQFSNTLGTFWGMIPFFQVPPNEQTQINACTRLSYSSALKGRVNPTFRNFEQETSSGQPQFLPEFPMWRSRNFLSNQSFPADSDERWQYTILEGSDCRLRLGVSVIWFTRNKQRKKVLYNRSFSQYLDHLQYFFWEGGDGTSSNQVESVLSKRTITKL